MAPSLGRRTSLGTRRVLCGVDWGGHGCEAGNDDDDVASAVAFQRRCAQARSNALVVTAGASTGMLADAQSGSFVDAGRPAHDSSNSDDRHVKPSEQKWPPSYERWMKEVDNEQHVNDVKGEVDGIKAQINERLSKMSEPSWTEPNILPALKTALFDLGRQHKFVPPVVPRARRYFKEVQLKDLSDFEKLVNTLIADYDKLREDLCARGCYRVEVVEEFTMTELFEDFSAAERNILDAMANESFQDFEGYDMERHDIDMIKKIKVNLDTVLGPLKELRGARRIFQTKDWEQGGVVASYYSDEQLEEDFGELQNIVTLSPEDDGPSNNEPKLYRTNPLPGAPECAPAPAAAPDVEMEDSNNEDLLPPASIVPMDQAQPGTSEQNATVPNNGVVDPGDECKALLSKQEWSENSYNGVNPQYNSFFWCVAYHMNLSNALLAVNDATNVRWDPEALKANMVQRLQNQPHPFLTAVNPAPNSTSDIIYANARAKAAVRLLFTTNTFLSTFFQNKVKETAKKQYKYDPKLEYKNQLNKDEKRKFPFGEPLVDWLRHRNKERPENTNGETVLNDYLEALKNFNHWAQSDRKNEVALINPCLVEFRAMEQLYNIRFCFYEAETATDDYVLIKTDPISEAGSSNNEQSALPTYLSTICLLRRVDPVRVNKKETRYRYTFSLLLPTGATLSNDLGVLKPSGGKGLVAPMEPMRSLEDKTQEQSKKRETNKSYDAELLELQFDHLVTKLNTPEVQAWLQTQDEKIRDKARSALSDESPGRALKDVNDIVKRLSRKVFECVKKLLKDEICKNHEKDVQHKLDEMVAQVDNVRQIMREMYDVQKMYEYDEERWKFLYGVKEALKKAEKNREDRRLDPLRDAISMFVKAGTTKMAKKRKDLTDGKVVRPSIKSDVPLSFVSDDLYHRFKMNQAYEKVKLEYSQKQIKGMLKNYTSDGKDLVPPSERQGFEKVNEALQRIQSHYEDNNMKDAFEKMLKCQQLALQLFTASVNAEFKQYADGPKGDMFAKSPEVWSFHDEVEWRMGRVAETVGHMGFKKQTPPTSEEGYTPEFMDDLAEFTDKSSKGMSAEEAQHHDNRSKETLRSLYTGARFVYAESLEREVNRKLNWYQTGNETDNKTDVMFEEVTGNNIELERPVKESGKTKRTAQGAKKSWERWDGYKFVDFNKIEELKLCAKIYAQLMRFMKMRAVAKGRADHLYDTLLGYLEKIPDGILFVQEEVIVEADPTGGSLVENFAKMTMERAVHENPRVWRHMDAWMHKLAAGEGEADSTPGPQYEAAASLAATGAKVAGSQAQATWPRPPQSKLRAVHNANSLFLEGSGSKLGQEASVGDPTVAARAAWMRQTVEVLLETACLTSYEHGKFAARLLNALRGRIRYSGGCIREIFRGRLRVDQMSRRLAFQDGKGKQMCAVVDPSTNTMVLRVDIFAKLYWNDPEVRRLRAALRDWRAIGVYEIYDDEAHSPSIYTKVIADGVRDANAKLNEAPIPDDDEYAMEEETLIMPVFEDVNDGFGHVLATTKKLTPKGKPQFFYRNRAWELCPIINGTPYTNDPVHSEMRPMRYNSAECVFEELRDGWQTVQPLEKTHPYADADGPLPFLDFVDYCLNDPYLLYKEIEVEEALQESVIEIAGEEFYPYPPMEAYVGTLKGVPYGKRDPLRDFAWTQNTDS